MVCVKCVYISSRSARRLGYAHVVFSGGRYCFCSMLCSPDLDLVSVFNSFNGLIGLCLILVSVYCSLILLFLVLRLALYLAMQSTPATVTWPLPAAGAYSFSSLIHLCSTSLTRRSRASKKRQKEGGGGAFFEGASPSA